MECVPPSPLLCPVPVYPSVAAIHLMPLFPMSVWPVGAWLVAALPSDPEQSQLLAGDGWSSSSTGVLWAHTAPAPFILPGARAYAFQTPFWTLKQLHPGVMTACCLVNAASGALWPGAPGALEVAGVQKVGAPPGTWAPAREAPGARIWPWCGRQGARPWADAAGWSSRVGLARVWTSPQRAHSPDSAST